ncbi:MAG: recombinase family protein [Armatimonadota bacterium]
MSTKPPLYIGYIRVSTDEQKNKGFSPQVQRARIEDYVEDHAREDNYQLVFYQDLGATGKYGIRQYPGLFNKTRPGLSDAVERLRAEAEARPVHFVCLHRNRLERKPLLGELLWDRIFIPNDITVHSVDEGGQIDQSPGSDLTRRVSSAASATVPAYAARRVSQAHDYRAQKGYIHCVPPYGWQRLPKEDDQRWHDIGPVSQQRDVLIRMKDKALAGWGTWRIARWLDQQGIDTPGRGHKWYPQTVADLLRNPIHAGYLRHRDPEVQSRRRHPYHRALPPFRPSFSRGYRHSPTSHLWRPMRSC